MAVPAGEADPFVAPFPPVENDQRHDRRDEEDDDGTDGDSDGKDDALPQPSLLLRAHDYQKACAELAARRNIIVHLGTGRGKSEYTGCGMKGGMLLPDLNRNSRT